MPIHEYRCPACNKKVTVFYRSLASVDHAAARCDRCGAKRLARIMPRVRVLRGNSDADTSLGPDGDVDPGLLNEMGGLDENDPRALGRFMRKMADETGEDLGPEFGEVIGRLEKGEDPERIEREMGDLFGPEGGNGMGGMDDEMGMPAAPEASEAAPKPKKPRAAKRGSPSKAKPKKKPRT
jgi:putative FmdB family regulatory protein